MRSPWAMSPSPGSRRCTGRSCPRTSSFRTCPSRHGRTSVPCSCPTTWAPTTPWSILRCRPGCCAARAGPSWSTPASATTSPGSTVAAWDHLRLDYLGNLARAGVRPEDVDLVVNTHLHVDHVGWNTHLIDGAWVPTFPNATYLMPKADFEFWNPANNPDIAAWRQRERLRGQRRPRTRRGPGAAVGGRPHHRHAPAAGSSPRPHARIQHRHADLPQRPGPVRSTT